MVLISRVVIMVVLSLEAFTGQKAQDVRGKWRWRILAFGLGQTGLGDQRFSGGQVMDTELLLLHHSLRGELSSKSLQYFKITFSFFPISTTFSFLFLENLLSRGTIISLCPLFLFHPCSVLTFNQWNGTKAPLKPPRKIILRFFFITDLII